MLQSVSKLIISKHWGRTPSGVKRSEILWEIKKYSLPGRPSTHDWVKSKTIIEKHQKLSKRIINQLLVYFYLQKILFDLKIEFFTNFFWFYSILAGWSTCQWVSLSFSINFWSFDTSEITRFFSSTIWLGVTNYQINRFFWSKICVIKSQKLLGNKKVNKCNEYC